MILHVQLDGRESVLSLTDFEARVIDGVVNAETPTRAGPDAPWRTASAFPAFQAALHSPGARLRRRLANPPVPWATAVIAGVVLRVHLWAFGTPSFESTLDRYARDIHHVLERGEAWRLVSYAGLHANLNHLLSNLFLIVWCGIALETVLGSGPVLALFLVSVVAGGLLGGVANPDVPSIGASGADFGFIGACVVYGWRTRGLLPRGLGPRFGGVLGALALWLLVSNAFTEGVDNWAHLGGLLAGGAATLLFGVEGPGRNLRVSGALTGLVAAGLVALPLVGPWLLQGAPVDQDGVRTVRPAAWTPGVVHNRELGWRSRAGSGAVSVATRLHPRAVSPEEAVAEYRASVEAVNPEDGFGFAVEPWSGPGGLEGRRVTTSWSGRDGPGYTDALLVVRGRYVHTVQLDTIRGADRLRRRLVATVVEAATFPPPDAWEEAEAAGPADSPRGREARARVLVDLGREAEAVALFGDPAVLDAPGAVDWLELQAHLGAPALVAAVDALLGARPDDRRARLAAVRLLQEAGEPTVALRVVEEGLTRAPEDTSLLRLRARLDGAAAGTP